ncbi:hypothetical protein [Natrinema sp. H-ect4]|uniref:hypothetical protein n=1 Tax=Natrinema sp. H-ect4 TaxID=3242699 RepID=UPI0035A86B5D
MNRRTLLTAATTGIVTTSGCIGGRNNGSGENYEPCNVPVISYLQLPEGVRDEVDIAFDEGQYATRGEFLWKKIDGPELQAIQKEEDYYAPIVDTNGIFPLKERTLQFEKTTPKYDEPVSLLIYQSIADTLNMTITVEYENEFVHKEQNMSIKEEDDYTDSPPKIPIGRRYGEYTLDITTENRGDFAETFEIGGGHNTLTPDVLYIQEESSDISIDVTRRQFGDPAPCPWQVDN